mmetsp:Transcript_11583/g.35400  ORF Transcript_11583/g.35400 Transcript_11583/m.35400 type:complete len:222 (-) Transcript_11583:361-1026(-)
MTANIATSGISVTLSFASDASARAKPWPAHSGEFSATMSSNLRFFAASFRSFSTVVDQPNVRITSSECICSATAAFSIIDVRASFMSSRKRLVALRRFSFIENSGSGSAKISRTSFMTLLVMLPTRKPEVLLASVRYLPTERTAVSTVSPPPLHVARTITLSTLATLTARLALSACSPRRSTISNSLTTSHALGWLARTSAAPLGLPSFTPGILTIAEYFR